MLDTHDRQHRVLLQRIAHRVMVEWGLLPDCSPQALAELDEIHRPVTQATEPTRDLKHLIWCSIDNEDSRDLDQLTVAEALPDDEVKILVAIADVDALVKKGSAIDDRARHNTTSVYTPARIFPMLPERLSTDLTSLNLDQDRAAIVADMVVDGQGSVVESDVYPAVVRNKAKLAYRSVAAWLDGEGPIPGNLAAIPG